ncbi:restriction endonuclease [Actinomadura madurae]|uniref:restriction endonuclease n=1 Tax=Actinomadura madurae TaxID=1993 RepID=UPI000D8F1A1C|nr:restriction endonuclease [Actinomadura madurae]SPT63010.1 Restriction endonuclease [Actinomadura madurae]
MPKYTLEEWRAVTSHKRPQPSPDYIVVAFPNEEIKEDYLSNISSWPEEEVRNIIGNMLGDARGPTLLDKITAQALEATGPVIYTDGELRPRAYTEFEKRLILNLAGKTKQPLWPGLTWVLDLLPHFPREAINAVSSFYLAHAQVMSDLKLEALSDAMTVIRYRYIIQDTSARLSKLSLLKSLDPREMEYLAAALYYAMGYEVKVTPSQKDGGVDVIATKDGEVIYVECKNHASNVDVLAVRAFSSFAYKPVTKGVMISTSDFTEQGPESAKDWIGDPMISARLKLINGEEFVGMLNEHLGISWNMEIDKIVATQKVAPNKFK